MTDRDELHSGARLQPIHSRSTEEGSRITSNVRPDLAVRAADRVEDVVEIVREKAIRPAEKAGRIVAIGLLVLILAVVFVFLLSIGIFRGLAELLPAWLAWMALGGIFLSAGLLCLKFREPRIGMEPRAGADGESRDAVG